MSTPTPPSSGLRGWLNRQRARWFYLLGILHRHYGNAQGDLMEYETAVDHFTRAVELDPHFAQAYLARGILYWREFDHPRKAIENLNKALALKPSLDEALFNRGVAHQQVHEYEQALKDFRAYLSVGSHPYWREYAEKMIVELSEWVPQEGTDEQEHP